MAQNYEGVSECCIDDSETLNDAKTRAKQLAEQDVREKVADYIKQFSKNRNFTFSDDEIKTITASVLKFVNVRYGKAIIQAYVTAQLDDNDISEWLNKYSQEKTALVAQNEDLKRQIAELEQKLSVYESESKSKLQTQTQTIDPKIKSKDDLAWRLFCLTDFRGALALYDELIKTNPNNAEYYFCRSRCYEKLGEHSKSKADRKKYDELRR
ncbi:MAG: hypothetical protein IKZ53_04505 [Selenomonadaceae bacterium]|nr:hypothetical protein [Selenomonadaceae bacterium]